MMDVNAAQIREVLQARAMGVWRKEGNELVLGTFVPGNNLAPEVAAEFTQATDRVSLDQTELGIVRAALTGQPCVSVASELSPEIGSGLWLRRFGADRSLALPMINQGVVRGVVAVAIQGKDRTDAEVLELISAFLGNSK